MARNPAIEVAAVYLGPPIQMYEVTPNGALQVPSDEVEREMEAALRFHLDGLNHDERPAATASAAYVDVPEAA